MDNSNNISKFKCLNSIFNSTELLQKNLKCRKHLLIIHFLMHQNSHFIDWVCVLLLIQCLNHIQFNKKHNNRLGREHQEKQVLRIVNHSPNSSLIKTVQFQFQFLVLTIVKIPKTMAGIDLIYVLSLRAIRMVMKIIKQQ